MDPSNQSLIRVLEFETQRLGNNLIIFSGQY